MCFTSTGRKRPSENIEQEFNSTIKNQGTNIHYKLFELLFFKTIDDQDNFLITASHIVFPYPAVLCSLEF